MAFVPFKGNRMRYAIENNDITTVKALLAKGVSPNIEDEFGRSFLWHAVGSGNRDITDTLINSGAEVKATEYGQGSLLHLAARKGARDIAERLLEKNPALLQTKNRQGESALHVAAESGYEEVVVFLLEKGADINLKNFDNRTPLYLAQRNNHPDMVALLKSRMGITEEKPEPVAINGNDTWEKLSADRIAHVRVEESIGYKITEIFNFAARERTAIYRNLETNAETLDAKSFDDLGDTKPVSTAFEELKKRGGSADIGSIEKKPKLRNSIP